MPDNERKIKLVGPNRASVQLSFIKSDDRWGHDWQLSDGEQVLTILKSREGSKDQDWPPSPPLQEISRHELPAGDAILGVGMAGKSHWSASYSLEVSEPIGGEETQIERGVIKADLACLQKVQSPDAKLGSIYEIGSYEIERISAQLIRFDLPTGKLNLKAICNGEMQTRFDGDQGVLKVVPAEISNSPVVATRWGYRISFEY